MVWFDAKNAPEDGAVIICACYDRTHRAFYKNGKYWTTEGRLMTIEPRKWAYEKDVIKDSFF